MKKISDLLEELAEYQAHISLPTIMRWGNAKRILTGHTPESDEWWGEDLQDRTREALERAAQTQETLSNARSTGGKTRADKSRVSSEWMRPIFDQAYAQMDADGSKQRGRTKLMLIAQRIAGPGHPDHHRRGEIKDRHARAYLADRGAAKKSGTPA